MHCEAAGQPGSVEDTQHMVFTCSLYSGIRCSYPHLFTRPPPREVPLLAQPAAGPPQLHPPSQLAPHLWIPPPAAPPHQPPAPPPPPPAPPAAVAAAHQQQPDAAGREEAAAAAAAGGGGAGRQPPSGAAIATLTEFFRGPAVDLASFCGTCRRLGRQRAGLPP